MISFFMMEMENSNDFLAPCYVEGNLIAPDLWDPSRVRKGFFFSTKMAALISHTHPTALHWIQRPRSGHHEEQWQPLHLSTDKELDDQRREAICPGVSQHHS